MNKISNSHDAKQSLFIRRCFINLLGLACFPIFVHANLPSQSLQVKGLTETANLSGPKNSTLSNADISIGNGFEQDGMPSPLFENKRKWDNERSSMRDLLLTNEMDEELRGNITQTQIAVASKNSASARKISENDKASVKAKGNITDKIRSLAIMLSVVAIPPAFVIGLLLYKVHHRNKRYAHRHLNHQHSWQS